MQAFLDSAREVGITDETHITLNTYETVHCRIGDGLAVALAVMSPLPRLEKK
jgi:hypothetical protein